MRASSDAPAASAATDPDAPSASFDVDESIAAAVLSHVHDLRDRLALACVSRVWRRVAATTGSWSTSLDEVVVDGALAGRLTDDRFASLMRYCGRLKRLEVRDAPKSFEANCLSKPHPGLDVSKFASLHTLILSECTGVSTGSVVEFLRRVGVHERPKEERLERLHLGGCYAVAEDLPFLWECVRHDRDRKKPFSRGALDLWECECEECEKIEGEGKQCAACSSTYCFDCFEGDCLDCITCCYVCEDFTCGCAESDEYVTHHTTRCDDCDSVSCIYCVGYCDECGETRCEDCVACDENGVTHFVCDDCSGSWCPSCEPDHQEFCYGSSETKGCFKSLCGPCFEDPEEDCWTYCDKCEGNWCGSCLDDRVTCYGSSEEEGCYDSMCPTCAETLDVPWFFECDACDGIWCPSCTSKWPVCVGNSAFDGCNERRCAHCASEPPTSCALDCGGVWCAECKPEMRAVRIERRNDEGAVEVIESLACPLCAEKTNPAEQNPRKEPKKKKPAKKSKTKKKKK